MEFKAGGAVPQKKAKMLFIECVGEYIEQAQIERTTRMGYSIIANRIAKTPLADIQLGKIRRADIGEYVRKLQTETQLSNATINKDLFLIGVTLSYAEQMDYIKANPAHSFPKLKEPKRHYDILEKNFLREFTTKLLETKNRRLIVAVYLALFQGLRRGEILGLKWENVSLQKNMLYIRNTITQVGGVKVQKPPKTEESIRDLIIHPETRRILEEFPIEERKGYVINQNGKSTYPTSISNMFRKFADGAGFEKVRFHDLRHSYCTLALQAGAKIISVSGAAGHSSVATTLKFYTHAKSIDGSEEVNQVFGIN